MRVGILGCGYLGEAAISPLKQQGYSVSVTTRRSERKVELEQLADDVFLLQKGTNAFSNFLRELDALIIAVAPDSPSHYRSTYLETANEVASHISEAPSLTQIIYTSSTSLYGDRQGAWVTEEMKLSCLDENREILAETEQVLLKCATEQLRVSIFRLGEIYGPGREIAERLRRGVRSDSLGACFPGTGDAYTNLIHRDDCIRAFLFAITHKLNGIYNLCNDFHVPRRAFYEEICRKENLPQVSWDSTRLSPHGGNRRVSSEKIKREGFFFTHIS